MKKTSKVMMIVVLAVVLLCAITACGGGPGGPGNPLPPAYTGQFTMEGSIVGRTETIQFGLDAAGSSGRAISDKYALTGWLKDSSGNAYTGEWRYDDASGAFVFSARNPEFRYTIIGRIDENNKVTSANACVYKEGNGSHKAMDTFTVTEITGADTPIVPGTVEEGLEMFLGTWKGNTNPDTNPAEGGGTCTRTHNIIMLGNSLGGGLGIQDKSITYSTQPHLNSSSHEEFVCQLIRIVPVAGEPGKYDVMNASPQYAPSDFQLADAFEGYLKERRGIPAGQIERVTQFDKDGNPQFTGNGGNGGKTLYAIVEDGGVKVIQCNKGFGPDWEIYLLNYMQNTGDDPVTYYSKSRMWIEGNTLHMPTYNDNDWTKSNGYPTMAEADAAALQDIIPGQYPNYDRQ